MLNPPHFPVPQQARLWASGSSPQCTPTTLSADQGGQQHDAWVWHGLHFAQHSQGSTETPRDSPLTRITIPVVLTEASIYRTTGKAEEPSRQKWSKHNGAPRGDGAEEREPKEAAEIIPENELRGSEEGGVQPQGHA